MAVAKSFKELVVWQNAIELTMRVFALTKSFPADERYSLTDQIRRASRSVASNISEGWRKRRYVAAFRSKLNECEGEAAETQTWIEIARRCGYWNDATAKELDDRCEVILQQLSHMIRNAESWCNVGATERPA